ncbi:MAG: family 2 glycosyl transferase [uncultured bacterium]|nr:MAG: family 2 glycosyl transferase [uncultured bacterium]
MISVAIPAHNEGKYILPCLQALAKQKTSEEFEVVICLNACTDDTESIIKDFAAANKINICLVNEPRKGVAFARDTAVRACASDIIANTDADSAPADNWLQKTREVFTHDPKAVAAFGPIYFPKEAGAWNRFMARFGYTFFLWIAHIFGVNNFAGINFAVRKDAYQKIGGIDLSLQTAEDIDLAQRLKKVGQIIFSRKLLVYTSPRRLEHLGWGFFSHHIKNFTRVIFFKKKPLKMKDIR